MIYRLFSFIFTYTRNEEIFWTTAFQYIENSICLTLFELTFRFMRFIKFAQRKLQSMTFIPFLDRDLRKIKSYLESLICDHFCDLCTYAIYYRLHVLARWFVRGWMHRTYIKSGCASMLPTARVTYAREIKYACMLQAQHASDSRVVILVALISSEMMSYISWNLNRIDRKGKCAIICVNRNLRDLSR